MLMSNCCIDIKFSALYKCCSQVGADEAVRLVQVQRHGRARGIGPPARFFNKARGEQGANEVGVAAVELIGLLSVNVHARPTGEYIAEVEHRGRVDEREEAPG